MTATVIPFPDPDYLAAVLKGASPGQKLRPLLLKHLKEARCAELRLNQECVAAVEAALSEEFQLTGGLAL